MGILSFGGVGSRVFEIYCEGLAFDLIWSDLGVRGDFEFWWGLDLRVFEIYLERSSFDLI